MLTKLRKTWSRILNDVFAADGRRSTLTDKASNAIFYAVKLKWRGSALVAIRPEVYYAKEHT